MFVSWWRNLVKLVYQRKLQSRRERQRFVHRPFPRPLWVELAIERLEDRITPTTDTWTGLSLVSPNWSAAGNWSAGVPLAGEDLVFPGSLAATASFASVNDLAAGTSFNSLTFQGGGYAVTGNAITLAAGGLTDTGSNLFQPGITLGATQTFTTNSGTLTLNGIVAEGANPLAFSGAGVTLLASGATVSGSSGLTVNAGASLTVNGADSAFTGNTIDNGLLTVGNNAALGSGTLTLNNGASLQADTTVTLANPVALGNNASVTLASGSPLAFNGPNTVTLAGADTVTVNSATTIYDPVGGAGASLTLGAASSGTLTLVPIANDTYTAAAPRWPAARSFSATPTRTWGPALSL